MTPFLLIVTVVAWLFLCYVFAILSDAAARLRWQAARWRAARRTTQKPTDPLPTRPGGAGDLRWRWRSIREDDAPNNFVIDELAAAPTVTQLEELVRRRRCSGCSKLYMPSELEAMGDLSGGGAFEVCRGCRALIRL